VKFLTDGNLGKLSKWLRILGYDTIFRRRNIDHACLVNAQEEGRVVLTRKQMPARRQYPERLLVIRHDLVEEQLKEVFAKLSLQWEPERFLTRCVKCNAELDVVSKDAVAQSVPDYVLENSPVFKKCPSCGHIFWPGTHKNHMMRFIKRRNQFDLP
jgi:hypothetical protein